MAMRTRHVQRKHGCNNILLAFTVLLTVVFFYVFKTTLFRTLIHQGSNLNLDTSSTTNDRLPRVAAESHDESLPPETLLFVAILSHWKRVKRRNSIRETWMTHCVGDARVQCWFFTDFAGAGEQYRRSLETEIRENKDMVVMPFTDRLAFAARLLWILQWSSRYYNSRYFLRIDDDHFLCLERLLFELPSRPKQALYWGFVHCKPKIVRIDEAWLILTQDLVEEILSKANTTLPCHPYGDQAVALWMNNSTYNVTYFMDNRRIVHKTAGHDPKYYKRRVCEEYLSLHGVFDQEMRRLWLVSHKLYRARLHATPRYNVTQIEPFQKLCPHSKAFFTSGFYPEFRYEPKPCRLKPTWSISHRDHTGREEAGERYSTY